MSQYPRTHLIRPVRWISFALLTLGLVLAGLPLSAASASADGAITGTVTYHEPYPDRTLEVYTQGTDGAWTRTRSTTVGQDGRFRVSVPTGEDAKLRVSYGDPAYGYWYGDAFTADSESALAVSSTSGTSVHLDVPVPVTYTGRLLDRGGRPVAGSVVPTVNTDGGSVASIAEPIAVGPSGEYTVILPARDGGVYECGVMGLDPDGDDWAWLGGGNDFEPNWYLNPHPGETHVGEDIELPIGTPPSSNDTTRPTPAASPALRATRAPVVHGVIRKGHVLRSTSGSYNKRVTAVRYQWLRNGKSIRNAHAKTYRLKKADVRKHISVRVTAYRGSAKVRATSARTALVRAR
jgi:hypothetical protein